MTTKKRIVSTVLLVLFCCTLSGCQCEHDWKEATCTSPKTCSICNETEGNALGHNWNAATCTNPEKCSRCEETRGITIDHKWIDATCLEPQKCSICSATQGMALGHKEGDWKVVETDMVSASEVLKKHCIVCEEPLDRKERDMDTLHDTYRFQLTPNEFVARLDKKLKSIQGSSLTAVSGSSEDYFACAVLDTDTDDKAAIMLFVGDGDSISKDRKNDICFDGSLGTVTDQDDLAIVLISVVETCDPSLSFSETKDLCSNILRKGEFTKNGITYIVTFTNNGALVCFALAD